MDSTNSYDRIVCQWVAVTLTLGAHIKQGINGMLGGRGVKLTPTIEVGDVHYSIDSTH